MPDQHRLKHWFGALSAGLPCLYLSSVLVRVWMDPLAWDEGRWVPYGIGLLMVEFLVIHSGGFIGGLTAMKGGKRWFVLVALVLLYAVMGVGMSLIVESSGLLYVFGLVLVGRVIDFATLGPKGVRVMLGRSLLSIPLYMAVTLLTVALPVPRLGITAGVAHAVMPQGQGGIWLEEPQRAICAATLYYAALGLSEIFWPERFSMSLEPPDFSTRTQRRGRRSSASFSLRIYCN